MIERKSERGDSDKVKNKRGVEEKEISTQQMENKEGSFSFIMFIDAV